MLYQPELLSHYLQYICDAMRAQDNPHILTTADQAYGWILQNQIFLPSKSSRRLSDVVLSAQLKISRTPVRQALARLAQQGLIQFDPRRGYWTQVSTAQDVKEIYELYEANELLSLKLAIPHLKRCDLQIQLDTVYSIRKAQPCIKPADYLEFDFKLHNLIIKSSGNNRLIRSLLALRCQIALFQLQYLSDTQRIEIALNDDELLLAALVEGKGEEAISFLSEQIQRVKKQVLVDIFQDAA